MHSSHRMRLFAGKKNPSVPNPKGGWTEFLGAITPN